jgi:hypothetical protein
MALISYVLRDLERNDQKLIFILQAYALMPGTFRDVIDLLLPELRRRGVFWNDYSVPGGTYRENLQETPGEPHPPRDHPAAKLQWRATPKENGRVPAQSIESPTEKLLDPQAMQLQ